MSHQDRKFREPMVVNHQSMKQAVDSLFTAKAFGGLRKARKGARWTPRMLVAVALCWAWSAAEGLKERFQEALADGLLVSLVFVAIRQHGGSILPCGGSWRVNFTSHRRLLWPPQIRWHARRRLDILRNVLGC